MAEAKQYTESDQRTRIRRNLLDTIDLLTTPSAEVASPIMRGLSATDDIDYSDTVRNLSEAYASLLTESDE